MRRHVLVTVALIVLAAVYTQFVLPGPKGASGRGTPLAIVFEYLLLGLVTGLTACSIVLVYRVQRFINFAAGAIGSTGAVFGSYLIRLTPCPFYVAVPAALLVGAMTAAAFELIFVRRFFNAPRLTLTVMTIFATFALISVVIVELIKLPFFPRQSSIDPEKLIGKIGPLLPFPGFTFHIGHLDLPFGFGAIFAIWTAALMLGGLAWFLYSTRTGIAARAVADNPDRAELLGLSTRRISTMVWMVVGVLGAATALAAVFLDISTTGAGATSNDAQVNMLLVPLVAAVIARMRGFTDAMIAAVVLTIVSGAITYSYPGSDSAVSAALFVALCVGLVAQRRTLLRSEAAERGGWQSTAEVRPIPVELRRVPTVRYARIGVVIVTVGFAILFPFFFSTRITTLGAGAILFSIAALSLVVLTGWAGQISFGQVGLVAVGALSGGSLMTKAGVPFWFAVPMAAAITAAAALLIGLPALRIRGLFLAATTFAFAVAASEFLFDPRYLAWLQPGAISRPRLFFLDFSDSRSMYYLCLAALLVAAIVVLNLRRSRFGRLLIAMRDNEAGVQAVGVSVARTKLAAFAVSGALAGFGGAIYAVLERGASAGDFGTTSSITLFAFTIVGGITSVGGALLGQIASFVLDQNAITNQIVLIFLGFTPLAILYFFPAGLTGVLQELRDGWLRLVAQRRQIVVPSLFADVDPDTLERELIPLTPPIGAVLAPGETYRRRSRLVRQGAE